MTPWNGRAVAEAGGLRVVLDTNVVLSALLFRGGSAARFRDLWQRHAMLPLVSSETAKELVRVLAYPKFRLADGQREELLADYLPFTEVVRPEDFPNTLAHTPICRDPFDGIFLDLAQAGDADMLITGDKDLLELNDPYQRHMRFLIVTPAEALKRWEN